MKNLGPGGALPGGDSYLRVTFGEQGDPMTTIAYDEDIICTKCLHLEPLISWAQGKHQCHTGRRWQLADDVKRALDELNGKGHDQ